MQYLTVICMMQVSTVEMLIEALVQLVVNISLRQHCPSYTECRQICKAIILHYPIGFVVKYNAFN